MFTWIQTWLTNAARSAYDPTFFAERLKVKTSRAVWHLYGVLWLSALITGITACVALSLTIPTVRTAIVSVQRNIPNMYPTDLVVEIKKGEVSTNAKEPVVIDLPAQWQRFLEDQKKEGQSSSTPHLLVIDTTASPDDFAKLHTIALLTKHSLVMPDKNDTVKLVSLEKTENMTITKAKYDALVLKFLPLLNMLPALVILAAASLVLILPFFMAAFSLLWFCFYLLFATVLLWVVGRVIKAERAYRELYVLSMYGLTLPLCYRAVEGIIGFYFFFAFTGIYLVWMGYVLSTLPKSTAMKKKKAA